MKPYGRLAPLAPTPPPPATPHFFTYYPHIPSFFPNLELLPMPPTAITTTAMPPTSLTARIQELVSACFTGIWLETCEPEEACREISSLCQTQSWRLASWDCDVGLKIHGHDLSTQHDNPAPTLAETLADTTDPLAVIRSAGQLSQGADTTPPCGGDIRLIVMRPQLCRLPAGAVSLRTGGSQADEGQDGFVRVKLDPHPPRRTAQTAASLARRPTGANSCRPTTTVMSFKRRIDELPAIDIHSL